MDVMDIRRITPADLEHPVSTRAELAMAASAKLGYNRLSNLLTTKAPLMDALVELDILPFKKSTVKAYKESKEHATMWSGYKAGIISLLMFAACIPIFSKLLMWSFVLQALSFSETIDIVGVVVSGLVGVIGLIVGLNCFFSTSGKGTRIVWRWDMTNLSDYAEMVPDFVLAKAIQIREKVPSAYFCVDYLAGKEERNIVARDPDPFLVVRYGSESYHIEVWDERKFEDTL